ncbi:hypothetical protein J6590_060020 [Homalodisca vitripennis]|nr:hypothetical protein J6590_060020 [Homalodisca vitripennis]
MIKCGKRSTEVQSDEVSVASLNKLKNDVNSNTVALSKQLEAINNRLDVLEASHGRMEHKCEQLERHNVELDKEVRTLRASLLAAEQHSRSMNLEINGIPLTPERMCIRYFIRWRGLSTST